MKKPRLYLETSVWNFLYADDSPDKMAATERFFKTVRKGECAVYISDLVLDEIHRAPAEKRKRLIGQVGKYRPHVLEDSLETQELIERYLDGGLLTKKQLADLGHVAIATVYEMDVLVSWNMRHLVKRKTRAMAAALNQLQGYRAIDICTPEEVVDYEEN